MTLSWRTNETHTRAGIVTRQADGGTVFIREVSPGRFDFIVEGTRGVVTATETGRKDCRCGNGCGVVCGAHRRGHYHRRIDLGACGAIYAHTARLTEKLLEGDHTIRPTEVAIDTAVGGGLAFVGYGATKLATRAVTPSAPRAIATGQEHHVISRRIAAALDDHPALAGQYAPRDPRFVTRAADAAAHRGYQTWHRQLDAEVVDWLARNPTTTQFERFLRGRYGQAGLLKRFPNGF